MMEQAVENPGCEDLMPEELAPIDEALIRGQDHRPLLVAPRDELEEEVGASAVDGQVANLIEMSSRGTV